MEELKVIKGNRKTSYKPTLKNYADAIKRDFEKYLSGLCKADDIKKTVFLGVKVADLLDEKIMTYEELNRSLQYMYFISDLMGLLAPLEIMQIFPITKTYDGDKYEIKDYFSTIKEVGMYPRGTPIGKENIIKFLMEYYNRDLMNFEVKRLCVISRMQRMMGGQGVLEQFFDDKGIPSYSLYEKEGIMLNRQTGEIVKIVKPKKRIPKYLKVVGGAQNG